MLLHEQASRLRNSNTWFRKIIWFGTVSGIFLLPQVAAAQCGPNLTCAYSSAANPTLVALGNGGRITFPSVAVNQTSTVTLTLNNTGTADGQVTSAMLQGTVFQMIEATPIIVPAGGAAIIHLAFTPPSTNGNNPFEQDLSLQYQTLTTQVAVLFVLQGSGLSAQVALSYAFPGGNQTSVDNGGQIAFPATLVGPPVASSTATFTIANTGNSAATLTSLSITGSNAFSLGTQPGLPAVIAPATGGTPVTFTVVFAPQASGIFQASLNLVFSSGTKTITLTGSALQPQLSYQLAVGSQIQPATAGGTFNLPNTNVGASAQFTVVITNTGSAAAQINAIAALPSIATGGAYSVSFPGGLTFPTNLASGQTLSFTLTFAPPAPGNQSGKLQINVGTATPAELDTITLNAQAIGPQLVFSVQVAGATTQLSNNGTILFPNTGIGTASLATISVANTGNADGTINQISVSPTPPYTLNPPSLPLKVPANGNASFTVSFAPQSIGAASGTLKVDTASFTLQGTGNPPTALPAITFANVPGTASPQSQPAIGLSLGSGYPLPLTGTLTLSFVSNSFVDDPAIQFSTGARTVTFTIPANTTSAIFGQNQTSIAFQTGTVAGVISIQADLAIGTVDVTPSPAPTTSITIPAAVPQIQSFTIGPTASGSVTLVMTGFSTPRDMSRLSLHFVAASGYTIQTTDLSSDVSTNFNTWYQSGASQPFGSQFSLTFQVNALNGSSITGVQSVTATLSNSAGVSNSATKSLSGN